MSNQNQEPLYYTVHVQNSEWRWCYSAKALQKLLTRAFWGQKLLRMMVDSCGYAEAIPFDGDRLNLTYMGGNLLLIFERTALELEILGEGLVRYRIMPRRCLRIRPGSGPIPAEYNPEPICFCDLNTSFEPEYEGRTVCSAEVDQTWSWAFSAVGLDEEKAEAAAEAFDLPNAIRFLLEGGPELCLFADTIENYSIVLET